MHLVNYTNSPFCFLYFPPSWIVLIWLHLCNQPWIRGQNYKRRFRKLIFYKTRNPYYILMVYSCIFFNFFSPLIDWYVWITYYNGWTLYLCDAHYTNHSFACSTRKDYQSRSCSILNDNIFNCPCLIYSRFAFRF